MTPDRQLAIVSIAEMYDAFVADWRMSTDPAWWDDMWVLVVSEFPETKDYWLSAGQSAGQPWAFSVGEPPRSDRERLGEVLRELVLHSVHGISGAPPAANQQIPQVIPPDITGAMHRHYARGNALVQFLSALPEYFQQHWQLAEAAWQGAHYLRLQQNTSTWLLAREWSALHSLDTWGEEHDALGDLAGSVSHGTMRAEDLFDPFFDIFVRLPGANPEEAVHIVEDWAKAVREGDRETQDDLVNELADELNDAAPPGYYFGSHPGDGADFGFWEYEDEDDA